MSIWLREILDCKGHPIVLTVAWAFPINNQAFLDAGIFFFFIIVHFTGSHVDYRYYIVYKVIDSSVVIPVWKRFGFKQSPSFDQQGRAELLSRPDKSLWFVEEFILNLDTAEELVEDSTKSVRTDLIKPVYVIISGHVMGNRGLAVRPGMSGVYLIYQFIADEQLRSFSDLGLPVQLKLFPVSDAVSIVENFSSNELCHWKPQFSRLTSFQDFQHDLFRLRYCG
jgi:hypothetical protein